MEAASTQTTPRLRIDKGTCHALFAYDVAHSIDLDECERRITAMKQRARLRPTRRAPKYLDYTPAPLRISAAADAVDVGAFRTQPQVDVVLFDFGGVSVSYALPLACDLPDLIALSSALYDNAPLLADSRRRVELLLDSLGSAAVRPRITDWVETYSVFQIESMTPASTPAELLEGQAHDLARILRAEQAPLSEQEVADATSARLSFATDDLSLIDWNGAVVFDRDPADIIAVLEFANVELLEMRFLDRQLDAALDAAYEVLGRRSWWRDWIPGSFRADLHHLAQMQVDSAILFEGVNNTLKLVGDQYLARLYRLVSQRLHLAEWDASILRKLTSLESIYEKMSDLSASWRLELLEWVIILLIAASIVIPFVPGLPH
jgi:hypothetical protein